LQYQLYIIAFVILLQNCRPKADQTNTDFKDKPKIPQFILEEHTNFLSFIDSLTLQKDSTGIIALKLKEIMMHHFREEEDYVLPALGVLSLLARDSVPSKPKEIILLTDKLKTQQHHIRAEHQLIGAFLKELLSVTNKEDRPAIEMFRKTVQRHAEDEETIYFPAAIVVGEHLKLRTKK
jgi:hemerythrin superfamily protein